MADDVEETPLDSRDVPEPPSTDPQAVPDPAAQAKAEYDKLREQLLRTAADFDNFRKRSRKEVDDAQKRGQERMIKEFLPVFDNLERAALHAESAPDVKSLVDGIKIVLKQLADTLEKVGIKRVQSMGAPFDPNQHEAIQHMESPNVPAGVILAEVQSGYRMGEQLVRAAMVVVSKGPPAGETASS